MGYSYGIISLILNHLTATSFSSRIHFYWELSGGMVIIAVQIPCCVCSEPEYLPFY